ncbi:Hsp70 family protein [Xinfangfangia sp. D13-10-4-6]|uniref:Hsp70 family protein n=1 Tax=Pseudogemmobacter hezensis TaxID=2737662 RepID=UPI0015566F04|nr:Hsp70 family protein [Pseudogemmobacter hezensis]NPD17089.1 Hsp70 family protein [Pseudogemmobacter hezensis]
MISDSPNPAWLAVDFGTSNTAVALPGAGGGVRRIAIEAGSDTLPTAVFFPPRGGMRIGEAAGEALIQGEEGRYMRALKSVLGTPLLHETRLIGGKRQSLSDIITAFLAELRARVTKALGHCPDRILSGRPVHFHTSDPARDAQAEADLLACYRAAGFTEIRFMAEPEAAAWACQAEIGDKTGLIIDIGGGTSDFSVFRAKAGRVTILANHGIRLGGTDFDRSVSMAHVMPRLGHGGELRREMGEGLLPVPNAIFSDLATWARIPFLYTPDTRREVAAMLRVAVDRKRLSRLSTVLEEELGHEMAFAVEHGKIAANNGEAKTRIEMGYVEPGLSAPISPGSLDLALRDHREALRIAIQETLQLAGLGADEIGAVILVGGSSLMQLVSGLAESLLPGAQIHRSEAFTAVVDGLALAASHQGA